jgi:hypothetical protein
MAPAATAGYRAKITKGPWLAAAALAMAVTMLGGLAAVC